MAFSRGNSQIPVFTTVADLQAADLNIGQYAKLTGDATENDGADILYKIHAPGFATPYGLRYIEISPSTNIASAINPAKDYLSEAMDVGGTANAIELTKSIPALEPFQYLDGLRLRFTVSANNTGAVTVKVGNLAAIALVHPDDTALVANDLVAGQKAGLLYDATLLKFTLVSSYSRKESVTNFDSVEDIAGADQNFDNKKAILLGWHPGSDVGGGVLYWDSSRAKSDHNGGTIFSPTVPWTTTTADYLNGVGETDPTGFGCWIRSDIDSINVAWFGAIADYDIPTATGTDNSASINKAASLGLALFGDGNHGIGSPLDLGIGGNPAILYGPRSFRPTLFISTLNNFSGFSMARNWGESMYSGPGESRDGPPADLTAFSDSISRYVNISSVRFDVRGTQANAITPIDLVAQQESSLLENIITGGDTGLAKGTPVRVSDAIGNEMSFNGFNIKNHVTYSDGWRAQYKMEGAGNDVCIDTIITTPAATTESPFQFNTINVKMRNIHSETYAVGLPTFDTDAPDFSISQGIIFIQDGQGDVFSNTNPSGTGSGRSGSDVLATKIFPIGGSWANVTNRNSINLYNDTSQSRAITVPLQFPAGNQYPAMIHELNRTIARISDGDGNDLILNLEEFNSERLFKINESFSSGTPLVIPYILDDGNSGGVAVVTGRNGTSGQPFLVQIAICNADNGAGFTPDHVEIISQTTTVPGVLSVSVVGNRCELATNDVTGGNRLRVAMVGNLQQDKLDLS